MAAKARLMANVIEKALTIGDAGNQVNEAQNLNLHNQYYSFKQYLIHDISEKGFADIYAQTIAYGMFAARLNDPTLVDFSRFEAAELIPKSNPFLRNLFQYIAGYDLDDRIKWIIDELADVFRATNVAELLQDFGKSTQQNDPMIHFYETFLAEYDPKLRKSRGVYYTPEPVVNFIVRAVDDILKSEFGIQQGLADTSKVKIKVKDVSKATPDLRSKTKETEREEEVHRVQILDPAAGTGTFLAEVIKEIHKHFEGQQGVWSNYVEEHLIPRLNGFEILMASYAMAHLKLDLLLKETGHVPKKQQRLKVFLTNSLEEHHPDTGTLFAGWLSSEANEANQVKRDTPVMVVIGNPPYSVSSSNKSEWIQNLISDYKKDLHEKNIQSLSDDYIKFIRLGQYVIDKNGEGILAYISNNSFIDGINHRQLRRYLSETFNKIYILDLHGSLKRREKSPDGNVDQNVFDIQQGVSINIFIKTGVKSKNQCADVFNADLFGTREFKYEYLKIQNLKSITWTKLNLSAPQYFFVKKEFIEENSVNSFRINELFQFYNSGLTTEFDELTIQDKYETAVQLLDDLQLKSDLEIAQIYRIPNTKLSKIEKAIKDVKSAKAIIKKIAYRPFDEKFIIYTGKTNGLMGRPRFNLMRHFFKANIGIIIGHQGQAIGDLEWNIVSLTKTFTDSNIFYRGRGTVFPLYLYSDTFDNQNRDGLSSRIPNLNKTILQQITDRIKLGYRSEKEQNDGNLAPIDILDYTYAVLHSPTYREKYKEFLKIDFPRIPYPKDQTTFWQLVKLGGDLRQIHLLESPVVNIFITTFTITGTNEVGKVIYEDSKVRINSEQYFDKVPRVAWEFYIGGYQPAQKWLKDRKGKVLSFDDIMHYQKIIVALTETDRIMKDIDSIPFLEEISE